MLLLSHHFFFMLIGRAQKSSTGVLVGFESGWLASSLTTVTSPTSRRLSSPRLEWVRGTAGHAQVPKVGRQLWLDPVLWNLQCDFGQGTSFL